MKLIKKYKKILYTVIFLIFLTFIYWWGGNSPVLRGFNLSDTKSTVSETKVIPKNSTEENIKTAEEIISEEKEEKEDKSLAVSETKTTVNTETKEEMPASYEKKSEPAENKNTNSQIKELYCTLSIKCDTILNNMDWLAPEKHSLVPENGVIFEKQKVVFYEGENVFNVLLREMKKNKIHMEFTNTPMYDSVYIEGINNLYEFDCGELSGWMYKVDGWFPNYGCPKYTLKEGCDIEWVYTCDLGKDVGGEYSVKAQADEKDKINE